MILCLPALQYFVTSQSSGAGYMNRDSESPYKDGANVAQAPQWPRDRVGLKGLAVRIKYLLDVVSEIETVGSVFEKGIWCDIEDFRGYVREVGLGKIHAERAVRQIVDNGARLEGVMTDEITKLFACALTSFPNTAILLREESPETYQQCKSEIEQVIFGLRRITPLRKAGSLHECLGPFNRAQKLLPMLREGARTKRRAEEIQILNEDLLAVAF